MVNGGDTVPGDGPEEVGAAAATLAGPEIETDEMTWAKCAEELLYLGAQTLNEDKQDLLDKCMEFLHHQTRYWETYNPNDLEHIGEEDVPYLRKAISALLGNLVRSPNAPLSHRANTFFLGAFHGLHAFRAEEDSEGETHVARIAERAALEAVLVLLDDKKEYMLNGITGDLTGEEPIFGVLARIVDAAIKNEGVAEPLARKLLAILGNERYSGYEEYPFRQEPQVSVAVENPSELVGFRVMTAFSEAAMSGRLSTEVMETWPVQEAIALFLGNQLRMAEVSEDQDALAVSTRLYRICYGVLDSRRSGLSSAQNSALVKFVASLLDQVCALCPEAVARGPSLPEDGVSEALAGIRELDGDIRNLVLYHREKDRSKA